MKMETQNRGLKSYLFGDKAFYKAVFAIVVPIIIQNLITSFVSLLDNVMVGQLGTAQMSGVAIANQLIFIFNICIFGGISGASIYGAQFYGSGDYEGMRAAMRFKLYTCLGIFAVGCVAFLGFDTPLIQLFLAEGEDAAMVAETLKAGEDYLRILMVGLLPFAVAQAYTATLREAGETMLPMLGGVAAVVTNTVLNYALIFGKLGLPEMGVRGAAVATVISRYVELALIVAVTHLRRKRYFYFVGLYRTMKVPLLLVKRIVIRGLPLLANESLWSVGLSFLTQLYSLRGLDVIAGINIASTVTNLFNTISFAMGNAVAIMVGQALGADEVERAKKTSGRLITFGTLVAAGMALLLCVVSPYIPLLYNTTDRVRTLATQFMLILALNMPLQAFGHCCYFTLRSGGKTIMTFIFDCMSVWVLSVPVVYALVHYTDMSIQWIYTICQLLNIIKCVFGFWLVKKGVWIHNITLETKEA